MSYNEVGTPHQLVATGGDFSQLQGQLRKEFNNTVGQNLRSTNASPSQEISPQTIAKVNEIAAGYKKQQTQLVKKKRFKTSKTKTNDESNGEGDISVTLKTTKQNT